MSTRRIPKRILVEMTDVIQRSDLKKPKSNERKRRRRRRKRVVKREKGGR